MDSQSLGCRGVYQRMSVGHYTGGTQPRGVASSILEYASDCRVLVACIEGLLATTTGPLVIIETGVCDGGSAFLFLSTSPRIHVMSYGLPDAMPEGRSVEEMGRWARQRLTTDACSRWIIRYEDSTEADWLADYSNACRGWALPGGANPTLVFLDSSHQEEVVFQELRKTLGLPGTPLIAVHDWDSEVGVPIALERWRGAYGGRYTSLEGTKLALALGPDKD